MPHNPLIQYRQSQRHSDVEGTLSSLIDLAYGSTQGETLYRDSDGWKVLAPGASGTISSIATTGNPSWLMPGTKGRELPGMPTIATIPLAAKATSGVLPGGSWSHTSAPIIITRLVVSVTTVSTGVATLSIGVAADGTTLSANLIDALDVNTAAVCVDNIGSGGTLGKSCQPMGITQFLNIACSADTTGIVGNVYVYYHLQ